jgi:hypothetical protein
MKTPSVAKLRVSGRDFAVVPWAEYRRLTANGKATSPRRKRLTADDPDRRDARNVARAVARYRAGTLQTISHDDLKRSLGL